MSHRSRSKSRPGWGFPAVALGLALAIAPLARGASALDSSPKLRGPVPAREMRLRTVPAVAQVPSPKRGATLAPSPARPGPKQVTRAAQRPQPAQDVAILPSGGAPRLGVDAPDLLPASPGGYCSWKLQGNQAVRSLQFRIENHGSQIAHPTDVRISFGGAPAASIPIGGYVYAGSFKSLNLAIPETCFGNGGLCSFQLEVDGAHQIAEANETNNSASGSCQAQ